MAHQTLADSERDNRDIWLAIGWQRFERYAWISLHGHRNRLSDYGRSGLNAFITVVSRWPTLSVSRTVWLNTALTCSTTATPRGKPVGTWAAAASECGRSQNAQHGERKTLHGNPFRMARCVAIESGQEMSTLKTLRVDNFDGNVEMNERLRSLRQAR